MLYVVGESRSKLLRIDSNAELDQVRDWVVFQRM
jgi:hypothetical protein